jgi:hypothetical protein
MKGSLLFLFALLVIVSCQTPEIPTTFPETWHSWVLTSVVKGKVLESKGQLIAFNIKQNYACRYDQQDLLTPKPNKPSDFCDFSSGYHYFVNKSEGKPDCHMKKMNESISTIPYPASFLKNAKYISKDRVNQRDCHHFYAPSVSDGARNFGMDLWFSADIERLPCQLSITDTSSNPPLVVTYAFDGISSTIPPDAIGRCQFPKSICVEDDYVCNVKNNSDKVAVQGALSWVCNPSNIDCTPIQPGGKNYYPNDLFSHANWAFNSYYLKHKAQQGSAACNFGGLAELVAPKLQEKNTQIPKSFLQNIGALFRTDLTCPSLVV